MTLDIHDFLSALGFIIGSSFCLIFFSIRDLLSLKVPVEVERENMRLTWTVDTQSEVCVDLISSLVFQIILPERLWILHQLRHPGRQSR